VILERGKPGKEFPIPSNGRTRLNNNNKLIWKKFRITSRSRKKKKDKNNGRLITLEMLLKTIMRSLH
jgi:hypothetical protein